MNFSILANSTFELRGAPTSQGVAMQDNINPVARIADLLLEPFSQGDSYQSADAGIAERIGLTQIGASYSEVPPRQNRLSLLRPPCRGRDVRHT